MSLIRLVWLYILTLLNIRLRGETTIENITGEKINVKLDIRGVIYQCECLEQIYVSQNYSRFKNIVTNRIYVVKMKVDGTDDVTVGYYPLLTSNALVNTLYPLNEAIRAHYLLYYAVN